MPTRIQYSDENYETHFLGAVLLTAPLWAQRPPEIPYESVPDPD